MGLFKPAWASKNWDKAVKAVEKLSDQNKLARAVREAESWKARKTAAEKLTDQKILSDLAISSDDISILEIVVEKLTDQEILAHVVKHEKYDSIRLVAAEKLTDQSLVQELYARIAKADRFELGEAVILRAIKNLTNQKLLFDVAINTSLVAQRAAIEKLTDQSKLAEVAKIDSNHGSAAVRMLTDHAMIIDVAKNARVATTRWEAIEKLIDQNVLSDIAKNTDVEWIGEMIVNNKLTDQDLLADVAKSAKADKVKRYAVWKLNDQNLLADVAKNTDNWEILFDIADKLTNKCLAQEIYIDIAKNADKRDIQFRAAEKIADQNIAEKVFRMLSKSDADWISSKAENKLPESQPKLIKIAKDNKANKYERKEALEILTDKGALIEIATSKDTNKYCYIWHETVFDDHTATGIIEHELDLRETARKRLAELRTE